MAAKVDLEKFVRKLVQDGELCCHDDDKARRLLGDPQSASCVVLKVVVNDDIVLPPDVDPNDQGNYSAIIGIGDYEYEAEVEEVFDHDFS